MGLSRKTDNTILKGKANKSQLEADFTVAIAGNPNVGKSTVFNALTGMKQHTGNWSGKTVGCATGFFSLHTIEDNVISFSAVDIPGTYSLLSHSPEEEIARNYLCFGDADAVIIVCDAVCLERNLNLVLQTLEIKKQAVVCVNLLDEAKHKGIMIDLAGLSDELGVPVVGTVARNKDGLDDLLKILPNIPSQSMQPRSIQYPAEIENAAKSLMGLLDSKAHGALPSFWLALRLLESFSGEKDRSLFDNLSQQLGVDLLTDPMICAAVKKELETLNEKGFSSNDVCTAIAEAGIITAEQICKSICKHKKKSGASDQRDRVLDRLFTGRKTAYPIMLALLALVFWITITGANYVSAYLSSLLFGIGDRINLLFYMISAPEWLRSLTVDGAYRVLAWIVSVMLPPMAIFFPLFTILEDAGYLPRVAFNLDKSFHRCNTCGKQALTMCMGFGCNAAGVVGCRIIDSPRERLIAILTNSLVPCNGRFPLLISIITMFFVSSASGAVSSFVSALLLTAFILLSILMTLAVSKLLSVTALRGTPSSFTIELPPYRRPQWGKVIIRSIFDRTAFVLGRAVITAIPAGILIWLMANLRVGDTTPLAICSDFLDPFARLMGLDGVILIAFILGLPANEIVIPIIIMAYTSSNTLIDISNLSQLKELFVSNGWTYETALCTMLFSLFHWPCATTLLTVKKETGHVKWTLAAAIIPTILGIACCILVNVLFFK
ncbi:MAG: ferrous iron transport protein B [Clostridia bacterium]|nr:ferrous iron transport protein B [Clostridia bacterium]